MESLTIAQINTHHCKAAMAELALNSHDNKVDIALIQGTYCYSGESRCNPLEYSVFYTTSNRNPRALILIKKDIAHNFIFLYQYSNEDNIIVATDTNPPFTLPAPLVTKYNCQSKHNKNYCIMFYTMFYNYMFRYKYVKNILFVYSHKTQLNINLSLLLNYNITTTCAGLNYRPSSGCI